MAAISPKASTSGPRDNSGDAAGLFHLAQRAFDTEDFWSCIELARQAVVDPDAQGDRTVVASAFAVVVDAPADDETLSERRVGECHADWIGTVVVEDTRLAEYDFRILGVYRKGTEVIPGPYIVDGRIVAISNLHP